jgi:hypothetical protein
MIRNIKYLQISAILAILTLAACSDEETTPSLRPGISYSAVNDETVYSGFFVDEEGVSTVDLADGNNRLRMFQALNYHSTSSISANTEIDATVLKNMFSNTGNPFYDIATASVTVTGSELNAASVELKSAVASSWESTEAANVRAKIETWFDEIDATSAAVNSTASSGVAGKLGSYLVDADGIELAQVIQKSLIGALQLDYIGNVLLRDGLNAENYKLVEGKNYTALEHTWDEAYGLLTLNPIYLDGSTNDTRGTVEFGAGSYIWEYNKENFANIYPAFLRGRIAIVNNDRAEYKKQAKFIRTEFEKTMARAAVGYLTKWKTGATDAARAHAIGEGLGFIYSLRFCTVHDVDATFSDGLMNDLIGSENGFWDLTNEKVNTAIDAINAKFNF